MHRAANTWPVMHIWLRTKAATSPNQQNDCNDRRLTLTTYYIVLRQLHAYVKHFPVFSNLLFFLSIVEIWMMISATNAATSQLKLSIFILSSTSSVI